MSPTAICCRRLSRSAFVFTVIVFSCMTIGQIARLEGKHTIFTFVSPGGGARSTGSISRASALWDRLGSEQVVGDKTDWQKLSPADNLLSISAFLSAWLVLASGLLGAAGSVLRICFLLYFVFSWGEWMFHKYLMHGNRLPAFIEPFSTSHWSHHRSVQPDMSLADHEQTEVYFSYLTTIATFFASWEVTTLLGWLLGWSDLSFWAMIPCLLASIAHNAYWNKLHPELHTAVDETWSIQQGIPHIEALPTRHTLGDWLLENHVGHHAIGGVGNYNVVVPGFDRLAGTYYYRVGGMMQECGRTGASRK
eukprot:TRINITY_DN33165_c0_g1_i1.p1 TRINITY_DN33165_c0_g1~~TRINITY_DN33165_c0_g1_i1.p1  ORF type:complete len:307 (-),score=35.25 TRINITY_DN33165_c0_g1_i1:444-1364(-)